MKEETAAGIREIMAAYRERIPELITPLVENEEKTLSLLKEALQPIVDRWGVNVGRSPMGGDWCLLFPLPEQLYMRKVSGRKHIFIYLGMEDVYQALNARDWTGHYTLGELLEVNSTYHGPYIWLVEEPGREIEIRGEEEVAMSGATYYGPLGLSLGEKILQVLKETRDTDIFHYLPSRTCVYGGRHPSFHIHP